MADRTMVDYTRKIKPYFEGIAPIEPTTTAALAHAVGDTFYLNGTKVKCTVAISVGDTIAIGTNVEEADDVESEIQTLSNNLDDEVETRAELGAHQLLDVNDNSNPINAAIANNGIVSTNTDTRAANIWVKCYKGDTAVGDLLISADLTVGKFKRTFTIPSNYDFDTLWIGHNGATRDLKAKIAFNKTGSFKFICNVIGANTSVSGGYALENILICLATDNDETWQPYAKTNQELTAENESLTNLVDCNACTSLDDIKNLIDLPSKKAIYGEGKIGNLSTSALKTLLGVPFSANYIDVSVEKLPLTGVPMYKFTAVNALTGGSVCVKYGTRVSGNDVFTEWIFVDESVTLLSNSTITNNDRDFTLDGIDNCKRISIAGYVGADSGGQRFCITVDFNSLKIMNSTACVAIIGSNAVTEPMRLDCWAKGNNVLNIAIRGLNGSAISTTGYIKSIIGYKH